MKKDLYYFVNDMTAYEKSGCFVIGMFCVFVMAEIEFYFKPVVSFSIFDPIPIFFVAFFAGRFFGLILSFLSPVIWASLSVIILHMDINSELIFGVILKIIYFIFITLITCKVTSYVKSQNNMIIQDPLTGAATRKYFETYMTKEVNKNRLSKTPMTVAYIDIDNFKDVNDSLGHQAGDEVLKVISKTILSRIRPLDLFSRVGGDEFVLVLSAVPDYTTASKVLKRILVSLKEEVISRKWCVTFSIGAVTFLQLDIPSTAMLGLADQTMYDVKKQGKNNLKHICHPAHKL